MSKTLREAIHEASQALDAAAGKPPVRKPIALPPLPAPFFTVEGQPEALAYSREQMQSYARAAIAFAAKGKA